MLKRYVTCLFALFFLCNLQVYGQKRLFRSLRTAKQVPSQQLSSQKVVPYSSIAFNPKNTLTKKDTPLPSITQVSNIPITNTESSNRTIIQKISHLTRRHQGQIEPKQLGPLSSARVSLQLRSRVKDTFKRAIDAQMKHSAVANMIEVGPSWFINPPIVSPAQELYPNKNFIETPQQLSDYFLSEHNRNLLFFMRQREQWRRQVVSNIPDFHHAKKELTHPPQQDMAWLVQQLPKQVTYLLIGEIHYFPNIRQQIASLLREVRTRYPKRPIFLLTEFLPNGNENLSTDEENSPENYNSVWETARQEGISVVGLEPQFVMDNLRTRVWYKSLSPGTHTLVSQNKSLWASLEGMRLRNDQYLSTIEEYHRRWPKALLIVYAGANHILYTEPYSLSQSLDGPKTFTVAFFPTYVEENNKRTPLTSSFDYATRGEFLDRVLQFDQLSAPTEDLSKLAGFNVRFRIEGEADGEADKKMHHRTHTKSGKK